MTLGERVQKDLVASMKAREAFRLGVLRLVKAALTNKRIELGREPSPDEQNQLLLTLVKQRTEALEIYEKAGRNDLAEKEGAERAILQGYLPEAVSGAEVERVVSEVITSLGVSSSKDIGAVMKETLARLKATGKTVDGKVVNGVVRSKLS